MDMSIKRVSDEGVRARLIEQADSIYKALYSAEKLLLEIHPELKRQSIPTE
jgi:hypothetical protein